MVEAGEKKSHEPPSAEELAQAEHYEAMMAAVARDDEDDYDLEDDELEDHEELKELTKQRQLLAAMAQQARQYSGLDFNESEEHDELMRQLYEEHLTQKVNSLAALPNDPLASQLL